MTNFHFTANPFHGPVPYVFSVPGRRGVVYNNGSIFPRDLASFEVDQPKTAETTARALNLINDTTRVVILDHPRFDVLGQESRQTREAADWMEAAVWAPLRTRLGRRAKIFQFGVKPEYSGSLNPSIVRYDPEWWRSEVVDLSPEYDRAVWIPAVGQWVPNRGGRFWTHRDFYRAVSLLDGSNDVLVWFDPGNWSAANYRATLGVIAAAINWPVTLRDVAPPSGSMADLLDELASPGFSMGDLVSILADWGDETGGDAP